MSLFPKRLHGACRILRRVPVLCLPGLVVLGAAGAVHADDYTIYSPHVVASQSEIELRGYRIEDGRDGLGGQRAAELSVAHAVTGWWRPEVYLARYEHAPGERGQFLGYELENVFQLTEPGREWADLGLLASYEHNTAGHGPDVIETGALIEKTVGRFVHTVNLIWERRIGPDAARHGEFRYSYRGTYALGPTFRAGIEAYGLPADHAWQAGPVVTGSVHISGTTGSLDYRIGLLQGINRRAPHHTWMAQVEYEFF